MDPRRYFDTMNHDVSDPSQWLALYLDQSLPIEDKSKAAFLKGQASFSRQKIYPFLRPVARLSISAIKTVRTFLVPEVVNSSRWLHGAIWWGLENFASPEANYLILRHFNIGTEILKFIADNVEGVKITTTIPLRPRVPRDLIDNVFLQHDINLYNFVIELNHKLRAKNKVIESRKTLDFSSLKFYENDIDISKMPSSWHNIIDLQTAIEFCTPLYAFFLSDRDFTRASDSLQLDEIISLYIGRIMGDPLPPSIVHNKHPTVPYSTLQAGFRLMLHGVDAETLYGYLVTAKANATKTPVVKLAPLDVKVERQR